VLNILEILLELLLVLGTSVWGWLGVVLGFSAGFASWELMAASSARVAVSAVTFVAAVFMVCAWQELRRGRRN
jgi:O-antigen ligase